MPRLDRNIRCLSSHKSNNNHLHNHHHNHNDSHRWSVTNVRETFIDYFRSKHQHTYYPSSPVIPHSDPTLLFANAGMNQFKSIFIGTVDPSSPMAQLTRAVNSQKCIRAGGKHNDLDDVGKDTYHHTFFEMLGTWSFGNYFKKEAIDWAFDLLVNVYGLPKERLYASFFQGDEALGIPCDNEAREYWLRHLPPDRVLPFDKKANFWEMGDTGPCGPCTEIHFDRIGGRNAASLVNADDPNVIEIWNLVFIQYDRLPNGNLKALPNAHVDTGMGLERLTSVLQNKTSNYDTDVFMPIIRAIEALFGAKPYGGLVGDEDAKTGYRDMAYRVLADHIRTLTFAISDGALPSNEGRGYVIRRILRRAIRYGQYTLGRDRKAGPINSLASKPKSFASLVPSVVQAFGNAYPEVVAMQDKVIRIIEEEERTFSKSLARGIKCFEEADQAAVGTDRKEISGQLAFFLYDTHGFPLDLTQLMAAERGLTVDVAGFQREMTRQQDRSRGDQLDKQLDGRRPMALGVHDIAGLRDSGLDTSNDIWKYNWDDQPSVSKVQAIFLPESESDSLQRITGTSNLSSLSVIGIVLEQTPFYAEAGGQICDHGKITISSTTEESIELQVFNVQSYGGYILHSCIIPNELASRLKLNIGDEVECNVDYSRRKKIAPNHTMTHLLNFALRKLLGLDVQQRGSMVTDEKLRFDFSYAQALTTAQLKEVEMTVNAAIRGGLTVESSIMSLEQARAIPNLQAVFGESYPDPVRVVRVVSRNNIATPIESIELCGGTHVENTAEAQCFSILEESSISKGVRRISAVTGTLAEEAVARGNSLLEEVVLVRAQMAQVHAPTVADLDNIESALTDIRLALDTQAMSLWTRHDIKSIYEACKKEFNRMKKLKAADDFNNVLAKIEQETSRFVSSAIENDRAIVFCVDCPCDQKAFSRITAQVAKVAHKPLSLLCVCGDLKTDDITVYANVAQENNSQSGSAEQWVKFVLDGNSVGRHHGNRQSAAGSLKRSALIAKIQDGANEAILSDQYCHELHSKLMSRAKEYAISTFGKIDE